MALPKPHQVILMRAVAGFLYSLGWGGITMFLNLDNKILRKRAKGF